MLGALFPKEPPKPMVFIIPKWALLDNRKEKSPYF
jgi:hypothetical protein